MFCLEQVTADLGATINANYSDQQQNSIRVERSAFVFVTAEHGSSAEAFEDLKRIDGVKELYFSRGAYDIVAKVCGESLENLSEIVFRRIKSLSSIKSTLTLTVV